MGRKDRRNKEGERGKSGESGIPAIRSRIISRRGWKVIGSGVGAAALGYIVLAFTDPRGQNMASVISPFLILGGYATIGAGILLKDPA
jgi:hypothetical protein